MPFTFDKLNWLAIAVAALATFFLGALWYMPLFGKTWIRLHGYTEERMKEMQARRPPPVFFGTMIVCYFLVAFVEAVLATKLDLDTAAAGAILGFFLWLGFAAAIGLTGHISSDRAWGIYAIDTGYQLVYLVMIGVIVAVWH